MAQDDRSFRINPFNYIKHELYWTAETSLKLHCGGLNATQLSGAESVPASTRYQISYSRDYISGRHTALMYRLLCPSNYISVTLNSDRD